MTPLTMNRICRPLPAAAICLLLPGIVLAGGRDDDGLLHLVGADAGLVVEVDGLGDSLPRLQTCEAYRRLRQTEVYRQWQAGDDFRKLVHSRQVLEQLLGKPLEEFIDDLFGRSVVLAVYPTGKTETRSVLITRARSAAVLESVVEVWNRVDRSERNRIRFGGHDYVRRTKAAGKKKPGGVQFSVQLGDVLALSEDEQAIHRVIALYAAANGTADDLPAELQSLAGRTFLEVAAHRTARGELPRQRFLSFHLNPRVWDARVTFDDQKPRDAEFFQMMWQRCDSIAGGLYADGQGVVFELLAHYDQAAQRPAAEPLDSDRLPALLSRVPRDAVAFAAGRHNLTAAAGFLLSRIPEKETADWNRLRTVVRGLLIGFDLFDDVLPAFGSGWGAYLMAAGPESDGRLPLEGVAGIELSPPGRHVRGNVTLRDGLDNALKTSLRLIASARGDGAPADRGQTAIEVESSQVRGSRLRWVDGGKAIQPAFALTDDHLIAGTSPGVLREFTELARGQSMAADARFRATAARYFPAQSQLLYVNATLLRQVVADHRGLLASRLAGSKKLDQDESRRRVQLLEDLLKSFDAAFFTAHADTRRIRIITGIAAQGISDFGLRISD